jgi:hypothetical protein
MDFTLKFLREVCKRFTQSQLENDQSWLKEALRNEAEPISVYVPSIEFTASDIEQKSGSVNDLGLTAPIWGRSEIEGRIICKEYNAELHVVEKHVVEGKVVWLDQIVNSEGSRSVDSIDYNEKNTIHIINRGDAHFEPILGTQEIQNNKQQSDLDIAKHLKKQDIVQILEPHIQPSQQVPVEEQPAIQQQLSQVQFQHEKPLDKQLEHKVGQVSQHLGQNVNQVSVAVEKQEQLRQKNTNIDTQSKQRKRGDPVHGNIYQLKLLMLFLYRGVSHKYSFHLGTEIEEAKKFDDLVFEYTKDNRKEYQLLQAKHRLDESKKVNSDDLLTESDGDYSLIKYFFSYQDSKKQKIFKGGSIKDVIVCTNIGLDFEHLQSAQIRVEKIESEDNILDTKSDRKQPTRYRFNEEIIRLLKPKLQDYNLIRLARRLAECFLKDNPIQHHQEHNIFKPYHVALAEEVIDVKTKMFCDKFIKNECISEDAKTFREAFIEEIKKQSKEELTLENINEAIINKKRIIDNKEVGLKLSKNFGKGEDTDWPNNAISDEEIKDFFNHLVFAVDQPNEEELGNIIKDEIGKEFDINTTENVYNKLFITMLNWLQGKERDRFLSYEDGKEFFEEVRRGISIWFDIREPVESFTGRVGQLDNLHRILQGKSETLISQVICVNGLGGVGKSELARKYINEYSQTYDNNIVWINAESYQSLEESFRRLARDKLRISTKNANGEGKEISSIVEDVYKFFSNRKSLFIFDNAEKRRTQVNGNEGIDKFLPSSPPNADKPYVLITSRNQKWGNIAVMLLDVFTEKEAADLIRKVLSIEDGSQENEIQKLAEILQCFPLALQQAVAYIKDTDIALRNVGSKFKISNYLQRYEEETRKLLDFEFPEDSNDSYTKTTFTTWRSTTDKIAGNQEYGEKAIDILNIMAYFAPENISTTMFLDLVCNNEEKLGPAVQLLKQYSMVDLGQEEVVLNIHRLVQHVIRINLKDQNKEEEILRKALELVNNSNKSGKNISHVTSVWNYASKYTELSKSYFGSVYGENERRPLHLLADSGENKAIEHILKYTNRRDIDCKDIYGRTPSYRATESGHVEVVKLLVENGADIKSSSASARSWHAEKWTILHGAAFGGADINARGSRGRDTFYIAIAKVMEKLLNCWKKLKMVHYLLLYR